MIRGIYQIRNLVNGHRYIGSSTNLQKRKVEHFYKLGKQEHNNKHLQSAYNKYGKENFVFEILLYCDIQNLILYEQMVIDGLKPEYNKRLECVNSNAGLKMSSQNIRLLQMRMIGNQYGRNGKGTKKPLRTKEHTQKLLETSIDKQNYSRDATLYQKVADSLSKNRYSLIAPDGTIYRDIKNLSAFAKVHQLSNSHLYSVANGKRKVHKGWRLLI